MTLGKKEWQDHTIDSKAQFPHAVDSSAFNLSTSVSLSIKCNEELFASRVKRTLNLQI